MIEYKIDNSRLSLLPEILEVQCGLDKSIVHKNDVLSFGSKLVQDLGRIEGKSQVYTMWMSLPDFYTFCCEKAAVPYVNYITQTANLRNDYKQTISPFTTNSFFKKELQRICLPSSKEDYCAMNDAIRMMDLASTLPKDTSSWTKANHLLQET